MHAYSLLFFSKPVQVTRAPHSEQADHHLHAGYLGGPKLTAPPERGIVLHGDYYLEKRYAEVILSHRFIDYLVKPTNVYMRTNATGFLELYDMFVYFQFIFS